MIVKMMENKKLLSIDTSDHVCSVCISIDDKILVKKSVGNKLNHSETLMPLIESAFNEVLFEVKDLDYIFVTDGPGSFTGIRIGVATAKALAHFKNIPIVTIKTLENIASIPEINEEDFVIAPLIDARRRTFYTMFFENKFTKPISEIYHIEIDDIITKLSELNKKVYLVGDKLDVLLKDIELNENFTIIDITENIDRAENILLNYKDILNNESNIKTYKTVEPFYLKKSQAEREYDEKNGVV